MDLYWRALSLYAIWQPHTYFWKCIKLTSNYIYYVHKFMVFMLLIVVNVKLRWSEKWPIFFLYIYFADRASQYIYLNIKQLDAVNFIMSLFHASTCFEHHVLIVRRSKLYYTASGIITPVGGRPVHRLREDCAPDGYLQVWWYQMLYNTVLTSWWWAHGARNM